MSSRAKTALRPFPGYGWLFLAADRWARAGKLSLVTTPSLFLACVPWIRAASAVVMGLLGDGVLDDLAVMFIPLGVMPTAAWRHHQMLEKEMPDTAPKLFCDFLIGLKQQSLPSGALSGCSKRSGLGSGR